MKYNIYCDESCHLEHDGNDIFVVGGIVCNRDNASAINEKINLLKEKHGFDKKSEIKWTKISPGNVDLFIDLIDLFFAENLKFSGYIGRGKQELKHDSFNQTYDDWYYKMYYRMLEFLTDNNQGYFDIYVDIKDTKGGAKALKLKNYLNSHYGKKVVEKIQIIRSDEVAIIQLTDVLIGALSYKHRGLESSEAKCRVIKYFEEKSRQNLLLSCPYSNKKTNWFVWTPDSWR